jgi:predicted heme/steroid binding protein
MREQSKKHVLIILITLIIILLLAVTACSAAQSSATTTGSQTTAGTTEQTFTLEQLAKFDGQNGNKAYIAVDGVVYDVTDVAVWDHKQHAGKFTAGKDYSAELKSQAPHGASMLSQAKRVGVLAP